MLSYQHEYHAGNLADIHKHILLIELWRALSRKGKPLTYIDTHAGRGVYDLSSAMAQKTREWQEGYGALKAGAFYDLIQDYDGFYPGSFGLISKLAKPEDALYGAELHPAEFKALRQNFPKANVKQQDGLKMALSLTPPNTKNGLVMIDPSYEVKTEFSEVGEIARRILKRWNGATLMIWYPILESNAHHALEKKLSLNGVEIFKAMFPKTTKLRMKGTAILVIGAPFGCAKSAQTALLEAQHLYEKSQRLRP